MAARRFEIIEISDQPADKGIRQSTRDQRKSEVITAAVDTFATDGYAAFSARSVAKRLGVSLSTVQHYYPTREILLVETIKEIVGGYVARFREIIGALELTPLERLDNLLTELVEGLYRRDVGGFIMQFWALAQHESAIGQLMDVIYDDYRTLIKNLVREIDPGMSDESANVAATLMAAQVEGMIVFTYRISENMPPRAAVAEKLRSSWRSLCKPPSTTD